MDDCLVEIVFKNVSLSMIGFLLKDLSRDGRHVVSYNCTCGPINIDWATERSIERVFIDNTEFGLFINLNELRIGELRLPNCGIAIFKNSKSINLEINFQLSHVKNYPLDQLVEGLMKFSKSIAIRYHIADYLCGLEPAEDMETRLFTNESLGPFFLS